MKWRPGFVAPIALALGGCDFARRPSETVHRPSAVSRALLGVGDVRGLSVPVLLAVATAVASCSVGPDYRTPAVHLPSGFLALAPSGEKSKGRGPASADLTQWWRSLDDPKLNSLEDRALQANLDLEITLNRIQEARAELVVIANQGLPQGGATAGGGVGTGTDETRNRAAPSFRSAVNSTGFSSVQEAGGFAGELGPRSLARFAAGWRRKLTTPRLSRRRGIG